MAAVKFSVVIPARERAETLGHTLRTCLDQTFDDYEVIVSDNAGSPATKLVVDEVASPKVRYFRTPGPVSMAANWEFAVSHARGEYVLVVGDDDALLPHALAELDSLTSETSPKAIRWEPAFYTWPSFPLAGQGGYLRVPLGRGVREVGGMVAIREVIAFRESPGTLPSIYHGAIRRDVLDELRSKKGRVFPNRYPAIYSGFAIAAIAGRFTTVDSPMSVSAQSATSLSAPRPFRRDCSAAAEFRSLNAQVGLVADPRVPDLAVFPHAPVAEAFLAAKRDLFPDSELEVNRRQLAAGCVSNLRAETEADWQEGLKAIRASFADDQETQAWFEGGLGKSRFRRAPAARVRPARLGWDDTYLHLDANVFGVENVAAAVELCERILNYRKGGVRHDIRDRAKASAETAELRRACSQQQQVIDNLQRICEERAEIIARLTRQRGLLFRAGTWLRKQMAPRASA